MEAAPPSPQEAGPYAPGGPPPIAFEGFSSLQTNSTRPGIRDEECYWLDGFMPVGPNWLRTMYGVGDPIYVSNEGKVVSFFDFFNIGPTPYVVVIESNGSIWVANTSTGESSLIAPAGTIINPSRSSVGISQWGSEYLLIVADQPDGYFIWDGINFFTAGTLGPLITLSFGGTGYTSPPTITAVGGHGSGATFSSTVANGSVTSIKVTNPGSGYLVGDEVLLAFSGGGSTGSTAILSVGTLNGAIVDPVTVVDGGTGYVSGSATATVISSTGSGGTITLTVTGDVITGAAVSAGGQNYATDPLVAVSDVKNPVARAFITIMPFGISGTNIETFNSQVWIGSIQNGQPTITFSAPESVSDFGTSSGGGSFPLTDSFLRVGTTQLRQSNGFLYYICDSSIGYISGVTTSATNPPTTTFTNQNADPEIGTPYAATVTVFSRNIIFANAFGVHVSYGGAVTKISDNLDGIYNTVPNFGGFIPSACKAIIFGKRVWALLLPVVDQITGQQVNKLFLYKTTPQGPVWWSTQQDVDLVYVAHQEINSVLTAYGTDGTSIYPLFQRPSTDIKKTVQSKLWAKPGGYHLEKSIDRLWGLVQYYSNLSPELSISIDNETGQSLTDYDLAPPTFTWTNNAGQPFTWTNNAGQPFTWLTVGAGITVFPPLGVGQNGYLVGLTVETNAADMALISLAMSPQIIGYRG